MRKLNLGCGGNILDGWENHDFDVDITKPLPYENNSVRYIFIEHCVEHTTTPEAVRFFTECYRILAQDGALRVAVPSADRILKEADEEYLKWFGKSGFGQPTKRSAIQSILLNHGHLSAWNYPTLEACLHASGFSLETIYPCNVGESPDEVLSGIDGHGKVIGEHNNKIETIVAEAVK
jgi:predicted SAM-dependent methyltransferase